MVRLFYSYSHKDEKYRNQMEKSLAILKRANLLEEWSDHKILPGQSISSEIAGAMKASSIFVFLLSPDFIASEECQKELELTSQLIEDGGMRIRIPIVIRDCPWPDHLGQADPKALPKDGKPVSQYEDEDTAWREVYEGIRDVVNEMRNCFRAKEEFLKELESTDFISQERISLSELLVFPKLTLMDYRHIGQATAREATIGEEELISLKTALIHGQEKSGKTTIARLVCLSAIRKSKPVLLVDLSKNRYGLNENFLRRTYEEQFDGDFSLWKKQGEKTLILENMTHDPQLLRFLEEAQDIFQSIIITMSTDTYFSYFKDERKVNGYQIVRIEPLTHHQQEQLIRKRLELTKDPEHITDGFVDRVEDHVNSVIISNKIVPRYPFYVLSILQTYERYMPSNVSVSSYGHCYHALIIASLIRAGISNTDDEVGASFNLLEHLAFHTYIHRKQFEDKSPDFTRFLTKYNEQFFIKVSTVNRLKNETFGVLTDEGRFKADYTYYYFLGKFLATHNNEGSPVILEMCEESHREENFLTLLFTIHHSNDDSIIEDILLRTMCTLDSYAPAALDKQDTARFRNILDGLPNNILSNRSVEEERKAARARIDRAQEADEDRAKEISDGSPSGEPLETAPAANQVYRVLKNNKIMGQILRNKCGTLQKSKIEEVISIISESGLRLISLFLLGEDDIAEQAGYVRRKHPEMDNKRIRQILEGMSFLWTLINIEMVVEAINVPEIREAVKSVVDREKTPAYDLIGYFTQLDSADLLREPERDLFIRLWKKHDDTFIRRVIAIRTQTYMNTHRGKAAIEQALCSVMGIRYTARLV